MVIYICFKKVNFFLFKNRTVAKLPFLNLRAITVVTPHRYHSPIRVPALMAAMFPIRDNGHRMSSPLTPRAPLHFQTRIYQFHTSNISVQPIIT
ncbi:hypothetical protein HanIR_Chr02g0083271 [Helianthus annuus]|nr:hypothetical protein HanIR_Chr02g0083271 [Helianthus annuus]